MLEVMIAFTLIALCAIPLIYPHVSMVKAQKESINKMKVNHAAKLILVNVLEKMYKGTITLNDIQEEKTFEVTSAELNEIAGYNATYQFSSEKHKERDASGFTVHKATLSLNFTSKTNSEKKLAFEQLIFFASKLPLDEIKTDEPGVDDEEYEIL